MCIAQIKQESKVAGKLWLTAYVATLLLPLLLIASRGLAEVAFSLTGVLFLWHSYQTKDWSWRKDIVVRIGLAAWAWLIFTSFFAVDPQAGFSGALPWIRYIAFYAALRYWVLTNPRMLEIAASALAALLALCMLDTLWQYASGTSLTGHAMSADGRLTGPLEKVIIGLFTAKLLLPATIIPLALTASGKRKAAFAALLLLGIGTILVSGERTAFFSIMLAATSMLILLAATERSVRIHALLTLATLLAISLMLFVTQDWVQYRVMYLKQNLTGFAASSYGQLFWTAWDIGLNHPIVGAGQHGFRILSHEYFDNHLVTHWNLHPHNPYLEWLAEAGFPGLILFSALVLALLFTSLRAFIAARGPARLLPAAALAVAILNFFPLLATQSNFSNWPAILLWYSLSLPFAALARPAKS